MKRAFTKDLFSALAATHLLPHRFRPSLLRLAGAEISGKPLIMSGLRIAWSGGGVQIGKKVYINHDCYFDARGPVIIEENVLIADHVRLITSTHTFGGAERRAGESIGLPVRIGAGSWLGAGAMVLPGVTVGPGCIVAAGAVVTRDCEANGLYAGVPAKRIRDLPTP